MVGDGPMRGQVEASIRDRGLDRVVHMLGVREDLGDLLQASDLLLLASATEGMPGAVIEAGMAGLPVAGYAIAGVPDVVVDGETGSLTPPGDARELALRVRHLVHDRDLRLRMGTAAEVRCRSRFDISIVAPRYFDLYGTVTAT
jgi:glycosyltransferase involved in cell wall biosynthesis